MFSEVVFCFQQIESAINLFSSMVVGKLYRGRALMLEHLPHVRYLHSSQGVLLIIYQNGDACFFPINDQSKNPTASVKLLTNPQKKLKGIPSAINCNLMSYQNINC